VIIPFVLGVLAKTLNERASGLPYFWGAYFVSCGVPLENITLLNKLGVTMSYHSLATWLHKLNAERKEEILNIVSELVSLSDLRVVTFFVCSFGTKLRLVL